MVAIPRAVAAGTRGRSTSPLFDTKKRSSMSTWPATRLLITVTTAVIFKSRSAVGEGARLALLTAPPLPILPHSPESRRTSRSPRLTCLWEVLAAVQQLNLAGGWLRSAGPEPHSSLRAASWGLPRLNSLLGVIGLCCSIGRGVPDEPLLSVVFSPSFFHSESSSQILLWHLFAEKRGRWRGKTGGKGFEPRFDC